MKVKITTLVLCMFCIIHANAQQKTDAFFNYKYHDDATRATYVDATHLSTVGFNNMGISVNYESVPLGSGLFVLTLISATYLVLRLRRKEVEK